MSAVINTRDGEWHPLSPGQHVATVKVYANRTRRNAWHGKVARYDEETRTWSYDKCPHDHWKRGAARTCSEAAAKRLNREAAKAKSFIDEHIVIIEVDI